jgi:hypothetical protein
MTLQQDLSAIWERIVREGQIRNRVTDADGRVIECGLRLEADGPSQYASDISTGIDIAAGVHERSIDGCEFTIQWNQYRSLKPQVRILGLGRQPETSADVSHCFFACQDPAHSLSLLNRDILLQLSGPNLKWAAF